MWLCACFWIWWPLTMLLKTWSRFAMTTCKAIFFEPGLFSQGAFLLKGLQSVQTSQKFRLSAICNKTSPESNFPWNIFPWNIITFNRKNAVWQAQYYRKIKLINDACKFFQICWVFANFRIYMWHFRDF